ncbi:MAG: hypothetical protein AAF411_05930 [Myxococcota bacterium]
MEFTYRGRITADDLRTMVLEAKALMAERTPKVQLVDTLAVESVPPEIGAILSELLEDYRNVGGKTVVMIATGQLNQMLGRSMSFGAGVELQLFETRPSALKYVQRFAEY